MGKKKKEPKISLSQIASILAGVGTLLAGIAALIQAIKG